MVVHKKHPLTQKIQGMCQKRENVPIVATDVEATTTEQKQSQISSMSATGQVTTCQQDESENFMKHHCQGHQLPVTLQGTGERSAVHSDL